MNAFDKFNDEQLPSKEQFYSRLTEEGMTNDDYTKAKQIWKHFDIKNMGEYHDLYLKQMFYYWLMFLKILWICA